MTPYSGGRGLFPTLNQVQGSVATSTYYVQSYPCRRFHALELRKSLEECPHTAVLAGRSGLSLSTIGRNLGNGVRLWKEYSPITACSYSRAHRGHTVYIYNLVPCTKMSFPLEIQVYRIELNFAVKVVNIHLPDNFLPCVDGSLACYL